MKRDLIYTVAIAWQSQGNMKLTTTVLVAEDDNIKNEDEALGAAISKVKNSDKFVATASMLMHKISSTWKEDKAPDLSCLRYC